MDGAEDGEPVRNVGGTYHRRGEVLLCAPISSVAARGAEVGLLRAARDAVGVLDARSAGGM